LEGPRETGESSRGAIWQLGAPDNAVGEGSVKLIKSLVQSCIKEFCVDSNTSSVDFSSMSSRTLRILKYLAENPGMQNARFMAIELKQPYNSLQKTLSRLAKRGIVSRPLKGFYELDHRYLMEHHSQTHPIWRWASRTVCDVLKVHRVGIRGVVPRLFVSLLETGGLVERDLRDVGSVYFGRSRLFDASMRLFENSCYYQRSCAPVPLRNVLLMYEDVWKSVEYFTCGLAVPESVVLKDFELGLDVPCDPKLFDDVSRVEIYSPKRSKGKKARVHAQFSKDISLPFGLNVERDLAKEWVEKMDLTVQVLLDAESKVRASYGLKSRKVERKIKNMLVEGLRKYGLVTTFKDGKPILEGPHILLKALKMAGLAIPGRRCEGA
jgi:hypothetical protein